MTRTFAPPVSCRLELLPGQRVNDQLQAAHRFGFDGVALPGRFLEQWLPAVRACRADRPLPFAGISLGFTGSLLNPQEAGRRACRESLLRLLDLAAELDAGWINVPPCLIQDNPARITDAGGFASLDERLDALLLDQLPALGDAAQERGVQFLLEPVNRYESDYLNSLGHAARLCQQLNHPAIGCTADFFHMQLEELNTANALRAAGGATIRSPGGATDPAGRPAGRPALRHVHVAENTRVEPGPGSLDFRPGFCALKEVGYTGWIEIECRRLSGRPEEVLPRSADYLRRSWREA
ncbi:MAG TPA: sugar phosphate isomerase/epimerase family protein [Verrucomicrobiae bacterium]|nr:sugar phosphate isomerase/epimerase family protein [Verrucomicrobiae bacterium]